MFYIKRQQKNLFLDFGLCNFENEMEFLDINVDQQNAKYGKINEKFLDIQIASGRDIYLSTNPDIWLNGDSFYSKELQYLISHGFKFKKMGEVWYVSRK